MSSIDMRIQAAQNNVRSKPCVSPKPSKVRVPSASRRMQTRSMARRYSAIAMDALSDITWAPRVEKKTVSKTADMDQWDDTIRVLFPESSITDAPVRPNRKRTIANL